MFFNSLVILIDGWNKHVTGVFHFLNLNKLGLTIVTRELMNSLMRDFSMIHLLKFARMIG